MADANPKDIAAALEEALCEAEGGGWTVCDTVRLSAEQIMWVRRALLAESILRKIVADIGCLMVRYPDGIDALIDSTWFDVTPEEADYLDEIRGT